MIYRLLRQLRRLPKRRSQRVRFNLSAPEICEPRQLLSSVPVVNSPLPAAPSTLSQYDAGMVGFDASTGQWQANRYDGTQFVTETIADWDSAYTDQPTVFGDIWGNGIQDVIRYDSASGKLIADWLAGASITTGTISGWSAGMNLAYFTAQDINGDGRSDILGYDRNTGKWAVSISKPNNKYEARTAGLWDSSVQWSSVSFADLDGDGLQDIFGYNPTAKSWTILLGTSAGQFTKYTPANQNSNRTITRHVVASFDGTPGAEILEWDSNTGEWIATSFAGRTARSTVVGQWRTNATWVDVAVGDFWGTGRKAVIGRDDITDEWWATWSVGSGVSTRRLKSWGLGSYADTQFADLNQDGRTDIISRDVSTGRWYELTSSTSGSVSTILLAATNPTSRYDDVRFADLTGDGKLDILARKTETSSWDLLLSQSSESFQVVSYSIDYASFRSVNLATGDFNGDGKTNLFLRDSGTNNWLGLSVTGSSVVSQPWNQWNAYASNWTNATVLDFDGDGDNDLLARDAGTGDWWLTDFEGTRKTTRKIANWDPSSDWQYIQAVDFDGNGSQDLIGWNKSSGAWHCVQSDHSKIISTIIGTWDNSSNWTDILVVDLFGTGKPVVLGRNLLSGYWWGTWKTNDGTSTRYLTSFNPTRTYTNTTLVDFDGNGKESVVTFDASSGRWYSIQFIGNNFKQSLVANWNLSLDWQNIFVADLDGDGKESLYGRSLASGALVEVYSDVGGFTQRTLWTILPRETLDFSVVADTTGSGTQQVYFRSGLTKFWFQFGRDSNNSLSFSPIGTWQASSDWSAIQVADINRDGRDDLVGQTPSGAWTSVSKSNGQWNSGSTPVWNPALPTSSVRLTDVPGISNNSLKATILDATPGLQAALNANETLKAAALLRNWVANNINYALFNELLERDAPTLADNLLVTFAKDLAGASCGGYGYLMAATLNLFGIDALIVGIGKSSANLTHTTTVIPIRNGNSYDFYLVDATFNVSLVDSSSSAPVSYFSVVDNVIQGNTTGVAVEQGSVVNRRFLSTSNRNGSQGLVMTGVTPAGAYVHTWADYGLDDYLASISPTLAANNYSTGYEGFFKMMSQVIEVNVVRGSGQGNADALAAFKAKLTQRSLPFSS